MVVTTGISTRYGTGVRLREGVGGVRDSDEEKRIHGGLYTSDLKSSQETCAIPSG